MHSRRRFGSTITALTFLIAVSVLAVISIEEVFKNFVSKEDRLSPHAAGLKRNRGRSAHISFPWNGPGDAENLKTTDSTLASALNSTPATTPVTVTVCSSEDYKSTVPLLASNLKASATTVVPEKVIADGSKQSLSSTLINPSPTIAGVPVTCVPIPAVPTGYYCQPSPQTMEPYPAYCAPYVSNIYTITQTFHSTDYSCVTSQISYAATFTVTVTVSVNSTSSDPLTDSNTLLLTSLPSLGTLFAGSAITPSLPTSFLLSNIVVPPSGASSNLPASATSSQPITCSNGSTVEREQLCVSSLANPFGGSSSALPLPLTATLLNPPATALATLISRSATIATSQKPLDSAIDLSPTNQASVPGAGTINSALGGATSGSSPTIAQTPFQSISPSTPIDAGTAVNTAATGGLSLSAIPNAASISKSAPSVGLASSSPINTPIDAGTAVNTAVTGGLSLSVISNAASNFKSAPSVGLASGSPTNTPIGAGTAVNTAVTGGLSVSAIPNAAGNFKSAPSVGLASGNPTNTPIDAGTAVNTAATGGLSLSATPNAANNFKSAASVGLASGSPINTLLTSVFINATSTIGAVLPSRESVASLLPSLVSSTRSNTSISSLVAPSAQGLDSNFVSDLKSAASSFVSFATSTRGAATNAISGSNFATGLALGTVMLMSAPLSITSSTGSLFDNVLPTGTATQGFVNSVPSIAESKIDSVLATTSTFKGLPPSAANGTQSSTIIVPGSATVPQSLIPNIVSVATSATGAIPSSSSVLSVITVVNSEVGGIIGPASAIQSSVSSVINQGPGVAFTTGGVLPVATVTPISRNISSILAAVGVLADDVSAVSSVAAVLPGAVSVIEGAVPAISSVAANLPDVVNNISKFIVDLPVVGNILSDAKPSATFLSGQLASVTSVPNHSDIKITAESSITNVRAITQVISTVTIFVPRSETQTMR